MASFNYYLRDKNKNGETPIQLFISYGSKRLKYPTLKKVNPVNWNPKQQKARETIDFPIGKVLNSYLSTLKSDAENTLLLLEVELGRFPETDELKEKLDLELGRTKAPETSKEIQKLGFYHYFNQFIQDSESGKRLTTSGKKFDYRSIQKYNTVLTTLERFDASMNLTFDKIDREFHSSFVEFLNSEEVELNEKGEVEVVREPMALNTVGKYIQVIKTFMAYATEKGWNNNMFFTSRQFRSYKIPGFSIYLDEEELEQIHKLDLSDKPHLERTRDLFIVACWTGLRYSDFTNINEEDIRGDFIDNTNKKTGEKVVVPIHWMVREVFNKYNKSNQFDLPKPKSNQEMNRDLKEVAKKVKVLDREIEVKRVIGGEQRIEYHPKWKWVQTHTARRSFATNVYKSGFPSHSLMKITGHKTEQAFLLYIKVTPEENAERLRQHWQK